ncbi:diguanylate cyclase [Enterovibrio norvegicus FF-33]|uniref:sensor domain-containing protein n=1 Tax=Enterovibrio norvegicus TaxID=188144 RepID=UPI00031C56DB|nr:GGDEF domain-containing phosphodiesterase [Enterovibrio norvegicus]OEE69891.1 diguanylate cyclase [Enterovibrio norvegicus FF-33]OEE87954.1 diguanylate cyclase [Enterovibrio norvegicus FF-162]
MTRTLTQKPKLFTHITFAVSLAVIVAFSISSFLTYHYQRDELIVDLESHAQESLMRLTSAIASYPVSVSINEYEKLAYTEAKFKQFIAVIIDAHEKANMVDESSYATGYVRANDNELERYRLGFISHKNRLDAAFFDVTAPIKSNTGIVLGNITIYVSNDMIEKELHQQIVQTLLTSIATALLLILVLLYLAKRLFITPVEQISDAIKNQDSIGIPFSNIPEFGNQELSSLSQTMNSMLEMIRCSHHSLRLEHSRLLNVIHGTRTGTWEWNVGTGHVEYNGAWQEILGWGIAVLNGPPNKDWQTYIHAEDRSSSDAMLKKLFDKEIEYYDCEVRLQHKSGIWINALGRANVVEWDKNGHPLKILGTHQNITAHKKNEDKLRLAAKVFTHTREGIIIADSQSRIIEVNDAFTRITGYSIDEVRGEKPSILHSGQQDAEFYKKMWHSLTDKGHWSGELWNRRKNGEIYPELLTISCVFGEDNKPMNYVAVFSDITSYKEHEHKLKQIAHFDTLTELPNRFLLGDRLKSAMKHAKRNEQYVAIIFLDLDGFKSVNDTHGHEVGDILLQEIAKRMQRSMRDSDTIARIGGDEFVAVLTGLTSPEDCPPLLPRLVAATSGPVNANGNLVQVSASFGITLFPQAEDVDADTLLRQADYAMYQAKLNGKRRCHFFDAELERTLKSQNEHLRSIGYGLSKAEFFLCYQPKISFRTGEIIGLEALIRWQHPTQGILMPKDFISSIENHSLIVEVGDWVLEATLQQLTEWQKKGFVTQVSVNIAPHQLMQPDFMDKLILLLARFPHIHPNQLQLEILETSALEDIVVVSQIITRCQSMGISFAIDDFGTGYASLTYLKKLPAETLKIDQSFVHDMLDNNDNLAILEGIITLANTFGRKVLAEGVEKREQVQLLLWLGCEFGQGFGISRPMRAENVLAWTKEWRLDPTWHQSPKIKDELCPLIDSVVINRARTERMQSYLTKRTIGNTK